MQVNYTTVAQEMRIVVQTEPVLVESGRGVVRV